MLMVGIAVVSIISAKAIKAYLLNLIGSTPNSLDIENHLVCAAMIDVFNSVILVFLALHASRDAWLAPKGFRRLIAIIPVLYSLLVGYNYTCTMLAVYYDSSYAAGLTQFNLVATREAEKQANTKVTDIESANYFGRRLFDLFVKFSMFLAVFSLCFIGWLIERYVNCQRKGMNFWRDYRPLSFLMVPVLIPLIPFILPFVKLALFICIVMGQDLMKDI